MGGAASFSLYELALREWESCRFSECCQPCEPDKAWAGSGLRYSFRARTVGVCTGVEQALKYIASGELNKIVLSRTLQLDTSEQVDVPSYLHNLARHNTKGYTFAVDLPALEAEEAGSDGAVVGVEQRTLIGASPELLVSREGLHLTVNPLAGSAPRSDDPVEDKLRAAALLESVKDRHEHAVVVEAVALALRPLCRRLDVPQEPSLIQTETMWHLSTEITGELVDLTVSSLAVALALHPTPAVCGSPTEQAKRLSEISNRLIGAFTRELLDGVMQQEMENG